MGSIVSDKNQFTDNICGKKRCNSNQISYSMGHRIGKQLGEEVAIVKMKLWLKEHYNDDKYWTSEGNELLIDELIEDLTNFIKQRKHD